MQIEQRHLDQVSEKIWKQRDSNRDLIQSWLAECSQNFVTTFEKMLTSRTNVGNHFAMAILVNDYDLYVKTLIADEEWIYDQTVDYLADLESQHLDDTMEGRL